MLNLISKNLILNNISKSKSIYKPYTRLNSSIPDSSFTVSYLIDSCNVPPEKAILASKYLTLKTPNCPDSVIQFFKTQGFTEPQIHNVILKFPGALSCNPKKNLLPKFQFLNSIGLSSSDIVKLLSARPKQLGRSLKNHLEPSFKMLKELLPSNDRTLIAIRRCAWILDWDFHGNMIPNMQLLRDAGVPGSKMLYVLTYQPRDFLVSTEQFRKAVEDVKEMGFDPMKSHFMLAVHAIRSMTKATWDKKIETYEKWGWSKDEILAAYRSDPWCMMKSEEKFDAVMDFLVNKVGLDKSVIVKNPIFISLSMEKRIVPRCLVYEYCMERGLIKSKNHVGFGLWLRCSESEFVKRLQRYEKEAPGVVTFYQEKLNCAN